MIYLALVIVAAGTLLGVWKSGGIPYSLSSLVFALPKQQQWVWSAWMGITAVLMLPVMLKALPETWEFTGFLTTACLLGVSATPLIHKDTERWHDTLAICAGVMSQICVAVLSPWWLVAWVLMLIKPCVRRWARTNCTVFLAEVICGITLFGSLITKMYAI